MTTAHPLQPSQPPRSLAAVAAEVFVDSRYEIVRAIATGGMGEIVEARHLVTGRPVVLKMVRRALRGRTDVVARMRREAAALGAMQHAGIVEIIDFGVCNHHGPFLVLERLEGRALDGLLAARGDLGAEGAMTVLRAVAAALTEVHRKGYVHRDVKPANIMVGASRGGPSIKLLDFGVVGRSTPGTANPLTVVGDLLGTLGYMAPEQLANVTVVDPRSDLYALGVVTLECMGVGLDALVRARREARPARAALGARRDIPEHVVALLDDMIALDPHARPASAGDVIRRLGSAGDRPVDVLGYTTPRETRDAPTHCEPALHRTREVDSRRRQKRAPYITPVRVMIGGEHVDGRSEDVSAGGMLITIRGAMKSTGNLSIRFALPTTGRIVSVEVVPKWKREQGGITAVGVEFAALDPAMTAAIESYVEYFGQDG